MNITTETIFWTQVASIITFVVALFVLYRLLVEQKDATIQLQKENIAYLRDQLTDAKFQSPDILVQSLSSRVELYEDELSRLKQDHSSTQEQVKAKEAELNQARIAAEELTKKINYARELLNAFNCPVCGAPLVKSDCSSKGGIDHECKVFMCGCKILDGTVIDDCLIGGGVEGYLL